MPKHYFVTGISTGVGKTVISALFCEHFKADYFKPVQTGYPPDRDSEWIKQIVSYNIITHPENYLLKLPASPHLAAQRENVVIDFNKIHLPDTSNTLILEGAGGLLVPLNEQFYIADLIKKFQSECILVVSNYLGCINHSLLSLYYLYNENIPVKCVVFNGNFEEEVKHAILNKIKKSTIIIRIPRFENLDRSTFQQLFSIFKNEMSRYEL
ncbi:MAG: ATP-dependent dethiobiotin synthetase BioD [Bacteroidia bacterium]|nr:MAG: ATP-dependent dethiobiotin synthetase BioD [Bacteroidia bacterium]